VAATFAVFELDPAVVRSMQLGESVRALPGELVVLGGCLVERVGLRRVQRKLMPAICAQRMRKRDEGFGSCCGRLGRCVLTAVGVAVRAEVEVVGLAAAGQSGVSPFGRECRVGEHERPIHREALRDVAGDRVSVREGRAPVCGLREQECGPDGYLVPTAVEYELGRLEVDVDDDAAVAVVQLRSRLVALDDDTVAHGESSTGQVQLLASEPAGGAHVGSGAAVEVGHVHAALGDHDAVVKLAGRPPVRHQPFAPRRASDGGSR
jgi:hypothetical protein